MLEYHSLIKYRGVAQFVACLTGGQEAAGSSPVTPTMPSVLTAFEVVRTLGFYTTFLSGE